MREISRNMRTFRAVFALTLLIIVSIYKIYNGDFIEFISGDKNENKITMAEIGKKDSKDYKVINNNNPTFDIEDEKLEAFEKYYDLDNLGRATGGYAMIDKSLMPTEERGSIGSIKPTGWHTVKYDIVDGGYLYNRSHLIGYQLTGENANEKNLITGTRYFNAHSMLMFENMVADYIKETGGKVLYRVTPIYDGDNLLASGVNMEAKSIEDDGQSILFNVFVYNYQEGVEIDFRTGESRLIEYKTYIHKS